MSSNPVGVFIPASEVFPGVQSNRETFKSLLHSLSLTDTLFWCARLNYVVSSSSNITHIERQQFARQFFSKEENNRINKFIKRKGGIQRVDIFFRGQILELIRWVALYCNDAPGDGTTFESPQVRRTFAKVALIASDIWEKRVFRDRFSLKGGITTTRRRALGAIRKSIEATSSAPDISRTLGRGWTLFTEYFQSAYPSFELDFKASLGLSIEEYYICLCSILTNYLSPYSRDSSGIFDVKTIGQSTPYCDIFKKYIAAESQTPRNMSMTLRHRLSTFSVYFPQAPVLPSAC